MEFIIHRTSQYTYSNSYRKVTGWDAWNLLKQQFFAPRVSWNAGHISWKRLEMLLKHWGKELHELFGIWEANSQLRGSGILLKKRWRGGLSKICDQGDVGQGSLIQREEQSMTEELGPALKRSSRSKTPWNPLAASLLGDARQLGTVSTAQF